MFNSSMIEGFLIYVVVIGVAGCFLAERAPTFSRKIVIWLLLILMTFPGFYLALVFWSGVISAFSNTNTVSITSPASQNSEIRPSTTPALTPYPSLPSAPRVSAIKSPPVETILHVEGVRRVPMAKRPADFYDLEDAIDITNDAKALAMIRKGRISMVENVSLVVILESSGYLTKIKVKSTGSIGWVKSSWLE